MACVQWKCFRAQTHFSDMFQTAWLGNSSFEVCGNIQLNSSSYATDVFNFVNCIERPFMCFIVKLSQISDTRAAGKSGMEDVMRQRYVWKCTRCMQHYNEHFHINREHLAGRWDTERWHLAMTQLMSAAWSLPSATMYPHYSSEMYSRCRLWFCIYLRNFRIYILHDAILYIRLVWKSRLSLSLLCRKCFLCLIDLHL